MNRYSKSHPQCDRKTPSEFLSRILICLLLFAAPSAFGQCQSSVTTVAAAANCTAKFDVPLSQTQIDPQKPYRLEELIDIAETNNPRTRIAWESAKQAADRIGIARSDYYPHLAALALSGDQRLIVPFPKELGASRGYILAETPMAEAGFAMHYNVFDFGRRGAKVDATKAARLASAAMFQRTNQEVAFRVVTAYYNLLTAQERLDASRQILKTAQTTQDAAEAQLANGRSTLPDVLNARAATAQATFDLQASVGAEGVARVELREAIGVEPSDAITVEQFVGALPAEVIESVTNLVETSVQSRPDLLALSENLQAAKAAVRVAQAEYRPEIHLQSNVAQASMWASSNVGTFGDANHQTVWNAGIKVQWTLFDGGLRKNEVRLAESKRREVQDEIREKQDAIGREVWSAYLQFQTAVRQHEAAETLFKSASTSYDASLDAYRYGVKNLIDVVSADAQLARARLALVQSRSALRVSATNLDYVTGNMLRQRPPVAHPAPANNP
jgi:outer membrane protein